MDPVSAWDYVGLFHELLRQSSDAVLLTRPDDGRILEANEAFLQLFGLTRAEVIGRTTLELGLWSRPEEREAIRRLAAETGRVDAARVHARDRFGGELQMQVSTAKLPYRGNEIMLSVARPLAPASRAG